MLVCVQVLDSSFNTFFFFSVCIFTFKVLVLLKFVEASKYP